MNAGERVQRAGSRRVEIAERLAELREYQADLQERRTARSAPDQAGAPARRLAALIGARARASHQARIAAEAAEGAAAACDRAAARAQAQAAVDPARATTHLQRADRNRRRASEQRSRAAVARAMHATLSAPVSWPADRPVAPVDDPASGRYGHLEAARRLSGLTQEQLWLDYWALGGEIEPMEVEAHIHELLALEPGEHDVVVLALNEALAGLGLGCPLPYRMPPAAHLPAGIAAERPETGPDGPEGQSPAGSR